MATETTLSPIDWKNNQGFTYLWYGYTDALGSAIQVNDSGGFLYADLEGNLSSVKQKYFYLFVPRATNSEYAISEGYSCDGSAITNYDSDEFSIVKYKTNTVARINFADDQQWDSIVDIYKVDILPNATESDVTKAIVVHLEWDFMYATRDQKVFVRKGTKDVTLTVNQSAVADAQIGGSSNFYYMTSNDADLVTAPLSEYYPIIKSPVSLSVSFNSNSSESSNINAFKYVYIRSTDTLALSAEAYIDSEWASLQQVGVYKLTNIRIKVFQVSVEANTSGSYRATTLQIQSEGSALINVVISQYSTVNPVIDIPEDAEYIDDEDYAYWNIPGAMTVSAVDRNNGAVVDPTSVLYKSNQANIYSTIEQKDNTLFLGNYKNNNTVNDIKDIVTSAVSDANKFGRFYGLRKIEINTSSTGSYPYIPDMTSNSQQKRFFKKRESYLLGLVFINKTGTWSTVNYVEKWNPIADPTLLIDGITNKTYYNKVVRGYVLSSAFTTELSSRGIIGVIPVYAAKNNHNVKCQGYLSPTLKSLSRNNNESLDAQYSWFYRDDFTATALPSGNTNRFNVEIQNMDLANSAENDVWQINRQICTLNTPEVEVGEALTDAELANSLCSLVDIYNGFTYLNSVSIEYSGKYKHSSLTLANPYQSASPVPLASLTTNRFISGYIWYGWKDPAVDRDSEYFMPYINNTTYYRFFTVYPWQRSRLGGEGPSSTIVNKRLLNSLYNPCTTKSSTTIADSSFVMTDPTIYRDYDSASLLRLSGSSTSLYQGNVDYISTAEHPYKAYCYGNDAYPYPKSYEGVYAGYDEDGDIQDPISIKYKTAPHIVLKFNSAVTATTNGLTCVELYDTEDITGTSTHDLISNQWIKCGDIRRIKAGEPTTVLFEEGDYFFGRFDSLRTYCYTNEDVNSVVEVVSGMLCSRINLDSRCDRNRGGNTPTVSPQNFNIFNPVYNQSNNWFTFVYEDSEDIIYNREYKNSLQWSMVKNYSSDIDDWCNIQNSHTLDLDGDKGKLEALVRIGNNLMAFQDTGIAQIQYNEKTQVATTEGVPIEIANSGRVEGKYYIHDNIGCQDKRTIAKGQSGAYFIDNINKSIYLLASNGQIADLCTTGGMKSWALANIDDNWWSYYDINSQEIIFANEVEALAFSDSMKKFNAFLGYGNIRWNFRIADKMCQICTPFLKQVLSSSTEYLSSSERRISSYVEHDNVVNTFWKKNSIDATKFFDNYSPVEIQLHCNPEPTLDKTFSTVEYRADCFDSKGTYLPFETFDTFRAWNEYQDTLETAMYFTEQNKSYANYSRNFVYRLKKKFRIWRIDMPRAFYGSTIYVPGNTSYVADPTNTVTVQTSIPVNIAGRSRDRIRNPWCNIFLSMDTSKADKIVFNDLAIQYFK